MIKTVNTIFIIYLYMKYLYITFGLFVKHPMHMFDIICSAKFGNHYLVIFCRPFIQLLGDLEELRNKTYNKPKPEPWDFRHQDHKPGRVPEVTKISIYLHFHALKLH
jgi:hypothetical protein